MRQALKRWIDNNDCSVATDSYLQQQYPESSDARSDCERDKTEGLKAGEYKITSVDVSDERATVDVKTETAESRVYALVRQGDEWLVDDNTTQAGTQRARLGESLKYAESYEEDGRAVDERLTVTILSFEPASPPELTATKAGHRWYKMQVRAKSTSGGPVLVQAGDLFHAVDASGQRYAASGAEYEPAFGAGSAGLAPGEAMLGYVAFELPRSATIKEIHYNPGASESDLVWSVSG